MYYTILNKIENKELIKRIIEYSFWCTMNKIDDYQLVHPRDLITINTQIKILEQDIEKYSEIVKKEFKNFIESDEKSHIKVYDIMSYLYELLIPIREYLTFLKTLI